MDSPKISWGPANVVGCSAVFVFCICRKWRHICELPIEIGRRNSSTQFILEHGHASFVTLIFHNVRGRRSDQAMPLVVTVSCAGVFNNNYFAAQCVSEKVVIIIPLPRAYSNHFLIMHTPMASAIARAYNGGPRAFIFNASAIDPIYFCIK